MSFVEKYLIVKTKKIHYSILIVWAALCAAAMLIPGIPTLGTGSTMSLIYPLAPLAGILFGPYAGGLAVTIGSLIGTIIAPHAANLGIWTFTTQLITALTAGYVSRGKWQLPVLVMIAGTAFMYTYPVLQEVWWFGWIYLSGMLMCIVGAVWGSNQLKKNKTNLAKIIALFITFYASFIPGCIVSDAFGIPMFDLTSELYMFLAWMMPLERVIFSLFSTILGIPLMIGLPKIKIYVGPQFDMEEESVGDAVDEEMKKRY